MLTYKEVIGLRGKLANGEITLDHAKELFWEDYGEGKRAWHTKDWKERRAEVIKDKCEICGRSETLTLQHHSHPKKYYEYEKDVTKKYVQSFIDHNAIVDKNEFSEYILRNYDYVPIPLCPRCESRYPNKRMRKTPQYLCTECRHEFDVPIHKSADELIATFFENEEAAEVRDKCFISKDQYRNKHHLPASKYWFLREKAKTRHIEEIGKEAFLLYLDDNIKYLSFEDTITACKKCAFNFDMNNLELCPNCKEYYKGIQYSTCIQCLPEEKRKAALETIEFGKEWSKMHRSLGID
jgi:hypothetical protein